MRKLVLVNTLAIICILFFVEAASRVFLSPNATFPERLTFNLVYIPSGFVRFTPIPKQVIYEVQDGKILYDSRKFKINEYGFRGETFPLKKEKGELRIIIIGGSHVFDLNSFDYEGNPGFPQLIQKYFRDANYKVTVINAGVPGSDTRDYFVKLGLDLHRYEPDIVIINSIWNDLKWISRMDDSLILLNTPPKAMAKNPMVQEMNVLDKALGKSVLFRKARDYYWKKVLHLEPNEIINEGVISNSTRGTKNFQRGLYQYEKNIIAAVQIIRANNSLPILSIEERFVSLKNSQDEKKRIQYHMVNVKSHRELVDLFEQGDAIFQKISREYGLQLFNMNKDMEGNPQYFKDHVHTTPIGSAFIAKNYFESLKPIVLEMMQSGKA